MTIQYAIDEFPQIVIPKDPLNPTDEELQIMGYTRKHWEQLLGCNEEKGDEHN